MTRHYSIPNNAASKAMVETDFYKWLDNRPEPRNWVRHEEVRNYLQSLGYIHKKDTISKEDLEVLKAVFSHNFYNSDERKAIDARTKTYLEAPHVHKYTHH